MLYVACFSAQRSAISVGMGEGVGVGVGVGMGVGWLAMTGACTRPLSSPCMQLIEFYAMPNKNSNSA